MTERTYTLRLDTTLLRHQRDWLLEQAQGDPDTGELPECGTGEWRINPAEGLIGLCDELLDQAEGFA